MSPQWCPAVKSGIQNSIAVVGVPQAVPQWCPAVEDRNHIGYPDDNGVDFTPPQWCSAVVAEASLQPAPGRYHRRSFNGVRPLDRNQVGRVARSPRTPVASMVSGREDRNQWWVSPSMAVSCTYLNGVRPSRPESVVMRVHHDGVRLASMVSGQIERNQVGRVARSLRTPVASMVSGDEDQNHVVSGHVGERLVVPSMVSGSEGRNQNVQPVVAMSQR
jgi:hypothetical protein